MEGFSQASLDRSRDDNRSHDCTFFVERCRQPQKWALVRVLSKSSAMRVLSVMCQFVTTVPVRDNSGLCGKSTVFTDKIGFGGNRKEGEAPINQFFEKVQKQAGKHVAHR